MVESRSWWPRTTDRRELVAEQRGLRVGGLRSVLGPIGLDLPPLEPGRSGDPGQFGPGSEVWRIGRERVLLAGGAAALLLQVAHPLVAAGVSEHSDFPQKAFTRLRSTLDATLRITFGDRRQAEGAAARVRATHARVRGSLSEGIGRYPAGTPYEADDPDLALWVHATLVTTALDAYERFVRALDRPVRSKYYEEAKAFGALFGVGKRVMPPTYEAFQSYVREVVEGGTLTVGRPARALAADILRPPVPGLLAPVRPVNRLVTAGLLPGPVREAFGLPWTARDGRRFSAFAMSSRAAMPFLPFAVRFWPHYRTAMRRMDQGYEE
jgi:uncharacterized protein (DUF2236 family)